MIYINASHSETSLNSDYPPVYWGGLLISQFVRILRDQGTSFLVLGNCSAHSYSAVSFIRFKFHALNCPKSLTNRKILQMKRRIFIYGPCI